MLQKKTKAQWGFSSFNQLVGGHTHLTLIVRALFMHKSPKRIASVAVYNADFPFLLHIKNFLLIALIWPKDKEALAVT